MKLSVIILNYNVRYFLELCILSVKEAISSLDAEIIVVDNNSQDSSAAMVKQRFPELTFIHNKENLGFSRANNQAVKLAKGEYVCILNPDTVVSKNTFTRILEIKKGLPNVGLVGPRLIDGTGTFLPESKRNIPAPLTSFKRLFGFKMRMVKSYYADHVLENQIGDVDVLVGAFMIIKQSYYKEVGGFDEEYFMYGEDIDLSYKIKKKGWQNYYIGSVPVIHYKGESTDRNAIYIERFYGAMRLFYKKHFKSNFVFDRLVSFGIRILSTVQSFRSFDKEIRNVDQYYLVSKDQGLADRLAVKLNKPITFLDLELPLDLGNHSIEIIFDNAWMTFEEILKAIQSVKKENVTFKIRPKSCNYIIGSNVSDGKGQVIMF